MSTCRHIDGQTPPGEHGGEWTSHRAGSGEGDGMRRTSYQKGGVIIAEVEFTSDAYILQKGFVEVYHAGPPEQRLSILGPGDIFGEMSLITERPRSASVRALEDVEARVFERGT